MSIKARLEELNAAASLNVSGLVGQDCDLLAVPRVENEPDTKNGTYKDSFNGNESIKHWRGSGFCVYDSW